MASRVGARGPTGEIGVPRLIDVGPGWMEDGGDALGGYVDGWEGRR